MRKRLGILLPAVILAAGFVTWVFWTQVNAVPSPTSSILPSVSPSKLTLSASMLLFNTSTPTISRQITGTVEQVVRTATPAPTGTPWDCDAARPIGVESSEGQIILEELVKLVQEQQKGDAISLVESWSISELDNYLVVEALLTSSEPGIYVLKQEDEGYRWLSSWGGETIYEDQIADYFAKTIPGAPKALFYCHNFSSWLRSTPSITSGPTDQVACTRIEHLDPDSMIARTLSAKLLDDYEKTIHQGTLEYDGDPYIDRLGDFFIVQANYKSEPPEIFVVKQTSQGFEIYGMASTSNLDRISILLLLDEQIGIHPDANEFPDELLTCLDIMDWSSSN